MIRHYFGTRRAFLQALLLLLTTFALFAQSPRLTKPKAIDERSAFTTVWTGEGFHVKPDSLTGSLSLEDLKAAKVLLGIMNAPLELGEKSTGVENLVEIGLRTDCGYPNPPHCPTSECGDETVCGPNCYGAAGNGTSWSPSYIPSIDSWQMFFTRCGSTDSGDIRPTQAEAYTSALNVLYNLANCD